jgi:hypothetical protein
MHRPRRPAIAQQAGRGEVGTEHLLAALALDPGSRARRVLNRLGVSIAAVKRGLDCYIGPGKQRRRKRGKADLACSFCGKSQKQVKKLVAGPGVYICDECIGLCNEIVAVPRSPARQKHRRLGHRRRRATTGRCYRHSMA